MPKQPNAPPPKHLLVGRPQQPNAPPPGQLVKKCKQSNAPPPAHLVQQPVKRLTKPSSSSSSSSPVKQPKQPNAPPPAHLVKQPKQPDAPPPWRVVAPSKSQENSWASNGVQDTPAHSVKQPKQPTAPPPWYVVAPAKGQEKSWASNGVQDTPNLPQDGILKAVDWTSRKRDVFTRCFLQPDTTYVTQTEADAVRDELRIKVEDSADLVIPPPIDCFEEVPLPEYVQWGLSQNNIEAPMPIQAQALPLVLAGHDVIGIAQTGSGKTLAFLLPAVVHIEAQRPVGEGITPIAMVLAPTRELAVQISEEAAKILKGSKVWAGCVYGGGNKQVQIKNCWGAQIVVATPGRLVDFLTSDTISAERVTYFVLDEADRMLDLGFQGDVLSISDQVRPDRQVLFFSATWSHEVQILAQGLCHSRKPVRISVGQKDAVGSSDGGMADYVQVRETIEQKVIVVDHPGDQKRQAEEKREMLIEYLTDVLEESEEHKVLVFVSEKVFANELRGILSEAGFSTDSMHGGRNQDARLRVLDQFRKGELRLLVATDVLGRGIDVPDVSHVVIFDMSLIEDYVHRIGRTARGKYGTGKALVFFEYYPKYPNLAAELIELLEIAKQEVPEGLRTIAWEVECGKREVGVGKLQNSWDKNTRKSSSWSTGNEGSNSEASDKNTWKNSNWSTGNECSNSETSDKHAWKSSSWSTCNGSSNSETNGYVDTQWDNGWIANKKRKC